MKKTPIAVLLLAMLGGTLLADRIPLEETEIVHMRSGFGEAQAGKSVDGKTLTIGGRVFAHGVGTHAPSTYTVPCGGKAIRFEALVGIDDEVGADRGSCVFRVVADGRAVAEVRAERGRALPITADLAGARKVVLEVTDGETATTTTMWTGRRHSLRLPMVPSRFLCRRLRGNLAFSLRPKPVRRGSTGRRATACAPDIRFSLCQYGWDNVPTWGTLAGGQLWRTTGDVFDTWSSVYGVIRAQAANWQYAKPGGWNDADMLVLGRNTWAKGDSRLTPNEQVTHMSLWAMLACPLMIGCDLAQMDDFTLSLLTNDEVIAIDQDERGAAAALVLDEKEKSYEVWARPLADGSIAFALLNSADEEQTVELPMSALGMRGK